MEDDKAALAAQKQFEYPGRGFAIPENQMSPAQRALIERMEAGPRGKVPINQRIWMQNISFAEVAERFGSYVSAEAPMTPREKEICILVVAAYWNSSFEWHWHEPLAHKHGITPEQTEAIRNGQDPRFEAPTDQLTYEIAHALLARRDVPDDLYARAMDVLGCNAIFDRIGLMGLYGMIAQTITLYRLQVPKAITV